MRRRRGMEIKTLEEKEEREGGAGVIFDFKKLYKGENDEYVVYTQIIKQNKVWRQKRREEGEQELV